VAALTVYDMVKAADKTMTIGPIALVSKTGGASGPWRRPGAKKAPSGRRRAPRPRGG
jgi:cyclic pyranopterin phosphate synthase